MATTATNFTPSPIRTAFIGIPPLEAQLTPIPQAELNFVIYAGAITAAAAGEDQSMKVTCNLPKGFAYIFQGLSMMFDETEAADLESWNTDPRTFISNTTGTGPLKWQGNLKTSGGVIGALSSALDSRTFSTPPYSKIIFPIDDTDAFLQLTARNTDIDEGVITLYFLATFLQFDLNQAHYWAVNTPVPVR